MAGLDASLEFVFQVRVDFAGRLKFSAERNGVRRGYTGVAGGLIEGPRLSGKVLPDSGGDWPHFMPDGVVYFEAIYVIEASDGTQIVINNRGLRHAARHRRQDGSARAGRPIELLFPGAPGV